MSTTPSYSASVDDAADRIVYSSGWSSVSKPMPNSSSSNSSPSDNSSSASVSNSGTNSMLASLHQTSVAGSSATFQFEGTRVAIRVLVPASPSSPSDLDVDSDDASTPGTESDSAPLVTASIQLDSSPPVVHSLSSTSQDQWGAIFWESDTLTNEPHTLIITNLGTDADASLILDAIDYDYELPATSASVVPQPTQASSAPVLDPTPVPIPVGAAALPSTTEVSTVFTPSTSTIFTSSSSSSITSTPTISPFSWSSAPTTFTTSRSLPSESSTPSPMDSLSDAAPIIGVTVAAMLVFMLLVYYFLRPIRKHSKMRRLEAAELMDDSKIYSYEPEVKRSISLSACTLKEPELGSPFTLSVPLPSLPPAYHATTTNSKPYQSNAISRETPAHRERSLQRHEHFTRAITPPAGRVSPQFQARHNNATTRMNGTKGMGFTVRRSSMNLDSIDLRVANTTHRPTPAYTRA